MVSKSPSTAPPQRQRIEAQLLSMEAASVVLGLVTLLYIVLCPYTKVEESFNIQATHDVLYLGSSLGAYDHHVFPGVVPRTSIGALVIAALAWPQKMMLAAVEDAKVPSQLFGECVSSCREGHKIRGFR